MKIDLRSDTLTLPTPQMQEAMNKAPLGDDVYGEDPSVNALEEKAAKMFGMEAALFCPTGTMTNQLAIKVHTRPGDEVICDKLSHIYLYEGGGIAMNAFSSVRPLEGDLGRITAKMVEENINNANDVHQPITRMVSLENTVNKGGGSIYNFNEIKKIKEVCHANGIILHLDGARLFNALIETDQTPLDYGKTFDSISICLSKGLGCPVGSLLLGKKSFIDRARRYRKAMGGGWRQAGALAAAGIYALDNHIPLLKDDHRRAKEIGKMLAANSWVEKVYPVSTNIILAQLPQNITSTDFVEKLKQNEVYCVSFGKHLVRFVTHIDFTDEQLEVLRTRLAF
ncbi:MAG: aminotransferase class I/II-fold pyridoxal phosphate-dependent enzyme [Flavobacterium lindanitolerans]|uniref:threonine aldolase family protein n=1 Tax=Flavobacterium lindanitolerans TaxID=428988 RepID=UPI001A369C0A|nr:GntG family PLP-dependent aldolase [Flavobacterium lindanitolerans]MBL7867274.1 aminotransferase class I/II-fold pyridoxal phosphate-dependent enzyme [Flavobacterium lindanitolerans]